MVKKLLLVMVICIGFMAMIHAEAKAYMLANLGTLEYKSYFASYIGCVEVAGGGGFSGRGFFKPIEAYVSALNGGGNEAFAGIGHFDGVSLGEQDSYTFVDENGKSWMCFHIASNADECDMLVDEPSNENNPVFPSDYEFPSCAQGMLFPGTSQYNDCVAAEFDNCGGSPGDQYQAFADYWGLDTSDLKNNEVAYRVFATRMHAWYALAGDDIDPLADPNFACLTDVDPLDFIALSPINYRCVVYGMAVGFHDGYSVKKNQTVFTVPPPGVLFNDVDTAPGNDPLTVDLGKVNKAAVPGVLTVNADGSFEWDLTGVDFTGIAEWTYRPDDGNFPANKTLDTTVTMEKK